jgi:transmembrane sensor
MSGQTELDRLEQAAAWRARLAESHDGHALEFSSWLAEDPRNREAWRRVQGPWQFIGEQATAPGVIQLRRAALIHAHDATRRSGIRRSRALWRTAAIAAMLLLAVGSLTLWQWQRPALYTTARGERRIITLADGSQVTLDSRSELTVDYTASTRSLTLLEGQARFDVAHDVERPFTVTADGHKVVATGTAFDVNLLGPELLVTLIRGHVVVLPQSARTLTFQSLAASPASASRAPRVPAPGVSGAIVPDDWNQIVLAPGEQLVMSADAAPQLQHINLHRVTAWEQGEVVFKNERLATVIAQMNRYGRRRLVLGDARAARLRISGVFREGDLAGFVSTLSSYLPVRAQDRPDGEVVLFYEAGASTP